MSDEEAWVYVEDDARLGPEFYRARDVGRAAVADPVLRSGLMHLPEGQVRRWEEARAAWEEAKAEMKMLAAMRRRDVVEAVGGFGGYEAAIRADKRSRR
ncbi:hypothetical protein ACFXKC_40725 [Streptomyces sp. NPDC059340]|uniref:hypothetical protein n=1 Tax=Streptomyces sp. NPDC059340 TaxID=3346806 RepID=UPI0036C557D4